ncbi:MAG: hypothetical protein ACRCYX_15510 [Dermatophilaceae bacterium]
MFTRRKPPARRTAHERRVQSRQRQAQAVTDQQLTQTIARSIVR